MARRRLRGAASGLAYGAADLAQMLLQNKMIGQRQTQQQQAQMDREDVDAFNTGVSSLMDPNKVQEQGPDRMTAAFNQRLNLLRPELRRNIKAPNFASLDTSPDVRLSQVMEEIGKADKPEAVPSRAGVQGLLTKRRLPTELLSSAPIADTGQRGEMRVGGESDQLTRAMEEATRKRSDLEAGQPVTGQKRITPQGTEETVYRRGRDIASGMTEQTGLSPEQEAARAGGVTRSQNQAQADVENLPANQAGHARGVGMDAAAKRNAELKAEMSQLGLTPQQQTAALQLSDDFTNQSKEFMVVRTAYRNMTQLAQQDSAATDIAMVYAFMKSQDPISAVREGEFATAQNAAGVPDRIRNQYNKLMSGERLSPEQRKDFVRTAGIMYRAAIQDHDDLKKDFSSRAAQMRVPPSLVVREVSEVETPEDPLDVLRRRGQANAPAAGTGR